MSATFGQLLSTPTKKIVRTDENVGINGKGFIQLNGFSSGYKGTRKFLKAVLLPCMVQPILLTLEMLFQHLLQMFFQKTFSSLLHYLFTKIAHKFSRQINCMLRTAIIFSAIGGKNNVE